MTAEPEGVLLDDIAFLLARAAAGAVAAGNAALRPLGLTARAFSTLTLAVERDDITQRALSDFLRLDPSRVVAIVDDLEARGLVQRRIGSRDRRVKVVVATADGRALCERAVKATRAAEQARLPDITAEDREHLVRVLRGLAFPVTVGVSA